MIDTRTPLRPLAFGLLAAGCLFMLVVLPHSLSRWLFAGLIVGGGALALHRIALPDRLRKSVYGLRLWLERHTLALSWMACGLMVASTFALRPVHGSTYVSAGAVLLLLGGVALLLALTTAHRTAAVEIIPALSPARLHGFHGLLTGSGMLCVLLLVEINGGLLGIDGLASVSPHVQFALWVAASVLIVSGLGGAAFPVFSMPMRPHTLALACFTLLAFTLRMWQLGGTMRFEVDEMLFAHTILRFQSDPAVRLFEPVSVLGGFTHLFPYAQTYFVHLFGHNFTGLRAASAVIGALTVPAVYLMARNLFDVKTALIAALLLATFPPHLQFSRLGLTEVAAAASGTWALAFIARAMIKNQRLDWAAGGMLLALTHSFHEGGRLLFTPLVLLWWAGGALTWRARPSGRGLLMMLATMLLLAAPVYTTLLALNMPLTVRMNVSGIRSDYYDILNRYGAPVKAVLERLVRSFLVYVNVPDLHHVYLYYGGRTALLLESLTPFFLLGLFHVLWRWRSPAVILLLWITATSLGNNLVVIHTVFARYTVVYPALMLCVAAGIRYSVPMLVRRRMGWIMGTLALLLAVGQAGYYFGWHLPGYNVQYRSQVMHCGDAQDALLRAAETLPPAVHIVFITPQVCQEFMELLPFLRADLSVETMASATLDEAYIRTLALKRNYAFVLAPHDSATLETLRRAFYLKDPQYGDYDVAPFEPFVIYEAPYMTGYSEHLREALRP